MSTPSCAWCGTPIDPSKPDCPACGAATDITGGKTASGWSSLPARRDLATLSFGSSKCQISGTMVPVADLELAGDDWVYFSHHVLLWKDSITIEAQSLKGVFKRLLAGMPLVMTQTKGPGRIAFTRDAPGEMIALPLHPGQSIDVKEHLFLLASSTVQFDWFDTGVWFDHKDDDDTETFYPIGPLMDRFSAVGAPGLLLLHAHGHVQTRTLEAGHTILVKPTAFLFKDHSVDMELHFEHPANTRWSNHRSVWLKLRGPGRVAIQSVAGHVEGEHVSINRSSRATRMQW